jgi:hypothetical protein
MRDEGAESNVGRQSHHLSPISLVPRMVYPILTFPDHNWLSQD